MSTLREFRTIEQGGLFFVTIDGSESPPFSTLALAHEHVNQEMTTAERAARAHRWFEKVRYEAKQARPDGVSKRQALSWLRGQRLLVKMWFWRGVKRADVVATLVAMMATDLNAGCTKKAA